MTGQLKFQYLKKTVRFNINLLITLHIHVRMLGYVEAMVGWLPVDMANLAVTDAVTVDENAGRQGAVHLDPSAQRLLDVKRNRVRQLFAVGMGRSARIPAGHLRVAGSNHGTEGSAFVLSIVRYIEPDDHRPLTIVQK